LADKYEASAVTHLAFFHLQPLVPRQFNRALALGTLYKHFNTVRLAIKYQRSSPVKMKGIPQDLFVQLSSTQIYALLQVEASTSQANYRSPDWPKLAKDLGIEVRPRVRPPFGSPRRSELTSARILCPVMQLPQNH
jgi:hypothetical protein